MSKSNALTLKDTSDEEYEHRICGMENSVTNSLRQVWNESNQSAKDSLFSSILENLRKYLGDPQHKGYRLGLALGTAMGAPVWSRTVAWKKEGEEEEEGGNVVISLFLVLDPLNIDSKQVTFVSKSVGLETAKVFQALYKVDFTKPPK
eukprot:TRINITY_DN11673_c0_g1_i1.p1 TRINITY_DN11673_c0_g1~~TRINITY_DN11673_c0_g1_i1.p1  ORF type:complete len:148 (-),score=63.20 TRINITY_DN11673_c0_g1_i1:41-484(-)